jgi:diaminopimelate epimerase
VRGTAFYKMTGSGNDFVFLDGRSTSVVQWPAERVRAVCDRRRGVGADGLVILTPAGTGAVRMSYWNSDGSIGAMCGNAALCSGRLAVHLQLVPPGEFCLLTDAGLVRVRFPISGELAEINLPDVDLPLAFRDRTLDPGERWMLLGSAGVPHLVIRVEDVELVEPAVRGRSLRFDPSLGAVGANVNFVSPGSRPGDPWFIRTYERGVEGETLACGTGAVVSALALALMREAALPVRFRSRGGLDLLVRAEVEPAQARDVWLGGEGRLVFRGVWEAGEE